MRSARFLAALWAVGLLAAGHAWSEAEVPGPAPVVAVPAVPTADPLVWLGMGPEAAYKDRGAPAEIFPMAVDDRRWQVVHLYPDHSYLFWTSNRVWQVRLDKLWSGTFRGLTPGMGQPDALALLGEPAAKGDTWAVWPLPYQTFPRKLRVVFTDGKVSDIFVYRSDL